MRRTHPPAARVGDTIRRLLPAALTLWLWIPGAAIGQLETGLQLIGGGDTQTVLSRDTEIRIEVNGLIARTRVAQSFVNQTDDWVEGRYVFPLPDGATVDELEIRIGERVIEGVVRERETARRTFERARTEGRSAGLVERHRGNLFSTRLTNIAPGEAVEVVIGFGQRVDYRHGEFRLRFPTATLPRYGNGAPEAAEAQGPSRIRQRALPPMPVDRNTAGGLLLQVELQAGFEIAAIESLHHEAWIHGRGSERTIELAPDADPGRDFELTWRPAESRDVRGAMFIEPMHDRAHAMLMLLPPENFRPVDLQRELIVVLDRSGSMEGEAFEQARAAVLRALDRLDAGDRFNVIAFNGRARSLFESPHRPSTKGLKAAAAFVEGLSAHGGTEFDGALARAVDGHTEPGYLRQIVFVTDGAIANEKAVIQRLRRDLDNARLFTVGIGHGVNDAFLGRLADHGRGTLTRIADPRHVAARMDELLLQLESPVLEDLQIDWPVAAEVWPERLPDLYAGEPVVVHARLDSTVSRLASGSVRVTGLRDLHFVEMQWPMSRFHFGRGVARGWAQARIEGLERRGDAIDAQLQRDEMLLTALDYGIVSSLTSLSAVDRTPRRSRDAVLKRTEVAGTPPSDRGSAILDLPATDAGSIEAGLRGLSILTIVLLLVFNRRLRERNPVEHEPAEPEARR